MNSLQIQESSGKVIDFNQSLVSLESTQKLCQVLIKTPHYAKMGVEGIFAIVAKARSLNIDPLDALNGGLYCVQGKVEMSSQMMNFLIRQSGHSVSKDAKSDDSICILHGRRADTKDTWTESFSIAEAKRANIYKENSPWGKYPRDMLFARALSRLARQLFPDVIKGCYVEGEISSSPLYEAPSQQNELKQELLVEEPTMKVEFPTPEEVQELEFLCVDYPSYKKKCLDFFKVSSIAELPRDRYLGMKKKIVRQIQTGELMPETIPLEV